MLNQTQLHEKILYPVTRVRSGDAGGSGVMVYSGPDSKNKGKFINICLTCHHVIADSIKLIDKWDSVLKRNQLRDVLEEVSVEVFQYDESRVVSANSTQAEIIAYDKDNDIAAVRLLNNNKIDYTAQVIAKNDIKDLKLFDPCWASGCSLLHDPFAGEGRLTYLREIIEQKSFLMADANMIFGNSGGGLFHGETGNLLGLSSRVTVTQLGFGVDVQTWMGFSSHPDRLYEFFEHQELQFIYDPKDDFYEGQERKKAKQKDALKNLLLAGKDLGDGETE